MPIMRVGIVGCGEAAQLLHLPSLYQLADKFKVTALCDVSDIVLQGVGEHWNVQKRFRDYQDLVQQDDVDIVLIANPNAHHAAVTLAAIEAGKHVLVEKPMCITFREADAIIEASRKADVIVQVGYMRRYAPAFVEACRIVSETDHIALARVYDVIGRNAQFIGPTSRVIRGQDIPQTAIEGTASLQKQLIREAIGEAPDEIQAAYSLLLGLSAHDLSAMRELLGMPQRVLYAAQRQGGRYLTAAFDYGDYVCHFETGVNMIPRFDAGLQVYSTTQIVKVLYNTPYVRNLPIRLVVTRASENGVSDQDDHPAWGDTFVEEWKALYDNIQAKRTPKTSPEDFRQDLALFKDMIDLMQA